MSKIYYWEQALIHRSIRDYQALITGVIEQLMQGNYASAGLEQLRAGSKRLYSARINAKARVIFSSIQYAGMTSLLVLDVLENHEYERCLFLESDYLRHFMGNLDKAEIEQIAFGHGDVFELAGAVTETDFARVHFFQGEMIHLSPEQNQGLSIRLPALIEGEAGSGKTCVGLCALSDKINTDAQARVLYLAPSRELVTQMRANWLLLNGSPRAEFKSYAELFTLEKIEDDILLNWIARNESFQTDEPLKTLKEFSMLMTIANLEVYLSLGTRQSIFSSHPERRKAWELWQHFKEHFDFNHHYHPWFSPLADGGDYDMIFVDESQSLTAFQLWQLLSYAKDRAMLAGFDRHQRLMGDRHDMKRFKSLCYQHHIDLSEQQLIGSFRCPRKVIEVVNNVLDMKYALAQGQPEKGAILKYESKQTEPGRVLYCLESKDRDTYASLLTTASRHWAIVTTADKKQETLDKFQHPLVFTPQEILGLGYPIIICYHLAQQEVVYQIAQELPSDIAERQYIHGASRELPDTVLTCFNEWIIAASRSLNTLIILESSKKTAYKSQRFINGLFRGGLLSQVQERSIRLETDCNWEDEVRRLVALNLSEQALRAYEQYVRPKTHISMHAWLYPKASPAPIVETRPMSVVKKACPKEPSAPVKVNAEPRQEKNIPGSEKSLIQLKTSHDTIAIGIFDVLGKLAAGGIGASMYKYAMLRSFLDRSEVEGFDKTMYLQHIQKLFNMPWTVWCVWINEPGRLDKLKLMINRHVDISVAIKVSLNTRLFEPSENYSLFFQYQLAPDTNSFFDDFFDEKSLRYFTHELFLYPEFVDMQFLEFLMAYIMDKPISMYGFDKFLFILVEKYFNDQIDIKYIQSNENMLAHQLFLKNLFMKTFGFPDMVESKILVKLFKTSLNKLHAFVSVQALICDIPLQCFLSAKQGIPYLEYLVKKNEISLRFLGEWLLNAKELDLVLKYVLSTEMLLQSITLACVEPEMMALFKSRFIHRLVFHELFIHKGALEFLNTLAAQHPDIWSGLETRTQLSLFAHRDGNKHCSFILKLLIDTLALKQSTLSNHLFCLLRSGSPPLYQQFNDIEWFLPLIMFDLKSKPVQKKPSWLMSPLVLMVRHHDAYEFLQQLLDTKPPLAKVFKWLFISSIFPAEQTQSIMKSHPLGVKILDSLVFVAEEAPELDLDGLYNGISIQPGDKSFFCG